MKTEIEDISPVQKKLKVEVPADIVQQARTLAIKQLQKEAKIEGFRVGKVPLDVIEKRFGREIQQQTVENVVDQTLMHALDQTKTHPISRPEIAPGMFDTIGNFSYSATFDVLPELMLKEKDFKGLKLEKEETKIEKEEMEAELKRLQDAMTQLEPTVPETPFVEGFVATIDFTGLIDGKKFPGSDSKDYTVEIGTGAMLADFEKELKGAKAGETREVRFHYPKDYFNKELAGKEARFSVKVKDIRKKNVPVLNDDFAKDLGEYKTMHEVRADLEKRMTAAKEGQQKGELYNQILKTLIEKTKFEIPDSLVRSELSHMLKDLAEEMKKRGQKVEELKAAEVVKQFQPEAESRVRGFLILNQIAKETALQITEKEMDDRLAAIAKGLNRPVAEVKEHYEKNRLLGSLETRILHEKALEFVLNEAKIKSVKPKKGSK
ncbi:MAG: trigger factor [Deltaproteobacteria bacterium]|nr:trigger factor [Deltaproteobacteria bacterium]